MTSWNGGVHPAAEHNPMLSEEALDRLALDIREHGLREPPTLVPTGELLDGRNRVEACRRAEVEPTFTVYDGDPWAFVISKNMERRHVSTGSRAATVALMLADQGKRKGGRWIRGSVPDGDIHESVNMDTWRNSMARAGVILDFAPDLLHDVKDERLSLDAAYKMAETKKRVALLAAEQEIKRREQELAAADGALSDYLGLVAQLLQLDVELITESNDRSGWKSVTDYTPDVERLVGSLKQQAAKKAAQSGGDDEEAGAEAEGNRPPQGEGIPALDER